MLVTLQKHLLYREMPLDSAPKKRPHKKAGRRRILQWQMLLHEDPLKFPAFSPCSDGSFLHLPYPEIRPCEFLR